MSHEKVYHLVMKEDEITWQTLLLDLVKNGDLDPWDVDISLLAQKYLEAVKNPYTWVFVGGYTLSAFIESYKRNK